MSRARSQTGAALVIAMLLMTLMMGVGLAAYAFVDQQTNASASEREREVSFNLTEQLLAAQVYLLSRDWPGTGGVISGPNPTIQPYPTNCTTGVVSSRCPNAATITSRFAGPDVAAGITWSTKVRDNQSPNVNYYDDAVTQGQPPYDANGDDKLWVRAQAIVRGKRRTLIGLVKIDRVAEDFPKSAIIAGKFGTNNNGKKVIVTTNGHSVRVRCNVPAKSSCLDYPPGKDQIKPDTSQLNYQGGDALSNEQLQRLRERAIAEGTWYATCPSNPNGSLVFVESGSCSYNNSNAPCCNSLAAPGVFVIYSGTFSMSGNIEFHGLIYAANRGNLTGNVVSNTGTSRIVGAVTIDRQGGLLIGSSGHPDNLEVNPNVFNNVIGYANAGVLQNTWREIPAAP